MNLLIKDASGIDLFFVLFLYNTEICFIDIHLYYRCLQQLIDFDGCVCFHYFIYI